MNTTMTVIKAGAVLVAVVIAMAAGTGTAGADPDTTHPPPDTRYRRRQGHSFRAPRSTRRGAWRPCWPAGSGMTRPPVLGTAPS